MRGELNVNSALYKYVLLLDDVQEVDLTEDLMVDGKTYECVKSFCYLGDTLDGDGGADLATDRIRNGRMKF